MGVARNGSCPQCLQCCVWHVCVCVCVFGSFRNSIFEYHPSSSTDINKETTSEPVKGRRWEEEDGDKETGLKNEEKIHIWNRNKDRWMDESLSPARLCVHLSPLLWSAILSLFFFTMFCDPGVMFISCLGSTHDEVFAGRLLWVTYCHYSLQIAQIAQEVVVALIPPFLHLSCSLMHTCCSLCCCLSCVYVVAHHVICLHELCISYYLQLFNSSKLSWCLTASFYPPVFKVNCDTSQPNGREIRRLKVSALLSVDR